MVAKERDAVVDSVSSTVYPLVFEDDSPVCQSFSALSEHQAT